jgi:hypothetical protein
MLPDSARRAGQGAPQRESAGGDSDARIVDGETRGIKVGDFCARCAGGRS